MGPDTRQTGRLIIAVAAIMVLTATGAVETDTLPTVGIRLTGRITSLDAVLALTLLFSTIGFVLRLVADLEGLVRRAREKELRRIRALSQVPEDVDAAGPRANPGTAATDIHEVAESTSRRRRLVERSAQLAAELDRLRQLGESGSRFSRFAAERVVVEAELLSISKELASLPTHGSGPAGLVQEARDSERVAAAERLNELRDLQDSWASSRLLAVSRSSRVILDLVLAPCLAALAFLVWGLAF